MKPLCERCGKYPAKVSGRTTWCLNCLRDRTDYSDKDLDGDDRVYGSDETEFIMAMDAWKIEHHNQFPKLVDAFRVAKSLGWHLVVVDTSDVQRFAEEKARREEDAALADFTV